MSMNKWLPILAYHCIIYLVVHIVYLISLLLSSGMKKHYIRLQVFCILQIDTNKNCCHTLTREVSLLLKQLCNGSGKSIE